MGSRGADVDPAPPLAVRVAQAVVAEIRAGAFPIGSVLPSEAQLARRFEVSRPSIREALSALQFAGYLVSRRGFGSIVIADRAVPGVARDTRAARTWAEVADLLEARLMLEPAVMAMAAADPDPAALDAAHDLVQGMNVAVSQPGLPDDTDHRVHAALAEICRNRVLSGQVHELLERASGPLWREGQGAAWNGGGALQVWCADHETVIRAIALGDATTAATASRRHLLSAVQNILAVDHLPPSIRKRLQSMAARAHDQC